MNDHFSEELLALARPHLAAAVEQIGLFDQLVPPDATVYDLDAPGVERSGVSLRAHQLGAVGDDGSWRWAWADERTSAAPGAVRSAELRALGEREGVPELSEPTVDLSGWSNPVMAGNLLATLCGGLLDARGCLVTIDVERQYVFWFVDDPAVPKSVPRADRLEPCLQVVAQLPIPAAKAVQGWCAHHGLEPEYGPGRISAALPGGRTVTVTLEGQAVSSVEVTVPEGGAPVDGGIPEQTLGELTLPQRSPEEGRFPEPLLSVAARNMAVSTRGTTAMVEYAGENLGFVGAMPRWDEAEGLLQFPDGGLCTRPLGRYDLEEGWFEWAPGTDDVRAAVRQAAGLADDADVPELAGGRLDLGRYPRPESVAVLLARTAAHVFGGVFTSLGNQFLLVTDDRLPEPGTDPGEAARDIRGGASWLGGMVPPSDREATMREVALSYFRHFGMQENHYGLPDFVSGMMGLYEVRVFFAPDGTIVDTTVGMAFTPGESVR